MYSPRRSYGSPPPELSNNPFIDHPSNALTRYPDISAVGSGETPAGTAPAADNSAQFTSWLKPSPSGSGAPFVTQSNLTSGYGYGQASVPYQQVPPQQQQQTGGWGSNPALSYQQQQSSGFVSSPIQTQPTGRPFQPSSSFGQQLQGAVNGAYGLPQQQPQQQQPQYSGYGNQMSSMYSGGGYQQQQPQYSAPQAQQQNAQYLAEFDPYSQARTSPTAGPYGGGIGGGASGGGAVQGNSGYQPPHPRDYIRQHKAEMESWDTYAWKQVSRARPRVRVRVVVLASFAYN